MKNLSATPINKTSGLISSIKSFFNPPKQYIDPSTYTTPDGQGGWFYEFLSPNQHTYFKYTGYNSCVDAYRRCPPVPAIINRKAQCFINGITWLLDEKGKVAEGPELVQFKKLMIQPNPIQAWRDFQAQMYVYYQMFGFCIILPVKPVGFTERLEVSSLWNIPACWIDVQRTMDRFTELGGVALSEIVITYNGYTVTLNVNDLIIIRDFVPSFDAWSITFPDSKIKANAIEINNIIGAYESRNVLINYRGALGILSGDPGNAQYTPVPIKPEEKIKLQNEFKQYGLKDRQFQIIITNAMLKWQQMGYATKDLMLMEEVEESTKSICANLSFPPFILGLADTTFNNMFSAEKALYQNSVIPDAANIFDQLSKWFGLYEMGLHLEKDFSEISVLQEDKKFSAETRNINNQARKIEWENGLITLNEWRVSNGDEPIPDGNIRSSDRTNSNVPLASIIGVGGIQGIIAIVTNPGMSPEAKQATLEILFGLTPADAQRMAVAPPPVTVEEAAKIFELIQYREPNGQYSGMTGRWNGNSPSGTVNFNDNGKGR